MELLKIYKKSISNKLKYKELLELWNYDVYDLLYLAYKIRKYYIVHNNYPNIELCSIINAKSGKCPENCIFCSQSTYNNTNIDVYGLKSENEILAHAKQVEKYCNRYSIVTSGKYITDDEFEKITKTIEKLKENTNLNICVSLGLIDYDKLKTLKELNVRVHNNLETSKDYFDKICTTHDYQDKLKTIKFAKKLDLEVCSGGIIGLGESYNDRFKMFRELKNLEINSVALNILHPIEGTTIYNLIKKGELTEITPSEILKTIAIAKIYMPNISIRLCGGRIYGLKDLQSLALFAIDGLMIGNYLTTKGRSMLDDILMVNSFYNHNIKKCVL